MANWDYTFRTSGWEPKSNRAENLQAAQQTAENWNSFGKPMGQLIKWGMDEKKKGQVDQLVMQYNQGSGPFEGIQGSLKTEKLVRLLLPLDRELSDRYAVRAKEEAGREEKMRIGAEVQKAGEGVADYSTDEEAVSGNKAIDDEIKAIEAELSRRAGTESYVATPLVTATGSRPQYSIPSYLPETAAEEDINPPWSL